MRPIQFSEVEPEKIIPLRRAVLRPDRPPEECHYSTDRIPTTFHLAAYDREILMGCASVHLEPLPNKNGMAYRLRGMAISEPYRNQGIGSQLLSRVEEKVQERKGQWVWCNGRIKAAKFYQRHGWQEQGDVFDIIGIPHLVFVKKLEE